MTDANQRNIDGGSPERVGPERADSCEGLFGAERGVDAPENGLPIRIYTLGRFSVAIDSLSIPAEGKGKHRPLSLLKALIAFGGRDIAIDQVWECLWPDSDGDLGARNLTVTLHRLRELLGASATVRLHDGKLTLNNRICWVDVWCFERCVNEGVAALGQGNAEGLALLRRAFDLYHGHFLACETDQPWMLSSRLRLKSKFERLVSVLAEQLERQGQHEAAADIWRRGIEHDPLNELIYRRLMRCYLTMGEYSSVLRSYRRCLEALYKGLGVQPSSATQAVYLNGVRAAARSEAAVAQREESPVLPSPAHGTPASRPDPVAARPAG